MTPKPGKLPPAGYHWKNRVNSSYPTQLLAFFIFHLAFVIYFILGVQMGGDKLVVNVVLVLSLTFHIVLWMPATKIEIQDSDLIVRHFFSWILAKKTLPLFKIDKVEIEHRPARGRSGKQYTVYAYIGDHRHQLINSQFATHLDEVKDELSKWLIVEEQNR